MRGIERANEYAKEKSSSGVFRDNHIKDFLAGYNQALKDNKAPEMLEMLQRLAYDEYVSPEEAKKLIKQATEL